MGSDSRRHLLHGSRLVIRADGVWRCRLGARDLRSGSGRIARRSRWIRRYRRGRFGWRDRNGCLRLSCERFGEGRQAGSRGEKPKRIEVTLVLRGDADPQVDVRLCYFGGPARSDGSDDGTLVDGHTAEHADRAEVNESHRESVRCLNRHGLATGRHRSCEGNRPACRGEHRSAGGSCDIDAAMLAARVRVRRIEREPLENRAVGGPAPGFGGRDKCEGGNDRQRSQHYTFHSLLNLLVVSCENETAKLTGGSDVVNLGYRDPR